MHVQNHREYRVLAGCALAAVLAGVFAWAQVAVAQVAARAPTATLAPAPARPMSVRVYALKYAQAEECAATLEQLLRGARRGDGDECRAVADKRTNALIVVGSDEVQDEVGELIKQLDVATNKDAAGGEATARCRVDVWWLLSGEVGEVGVEPSKAIQDIAKQLVEEKLEGLRQVGHALVTTTPDGRFQVRSTPMLGDATVEWTISGMLSQRGDVPGLQIQLSAAQDEPAPAGARPQPTRQQLLVDLDTKIVTPYDHYVVLGITPARKMTSVFVIQVSADKE